MWCVILLLFVILIPEKNISTIQRLYVGEKKGGTLNWNISAVWLVFWKCAIAPKQLVSHLKRCLSPSLHPHFLGMQARNCLSIKASCVFRHASGSRDVNVGRLVGPRLWSRLKYLNNFWVDCHEMWFRYPQSPEDESFNPWISVILWFFLKCHHEADIVGGFEWNISTTTWWTAMKSGTHIHVPLRMNRLQSQLHRLTCSEFHCSLLRTWCNVKIKIHHSRAQTVLPNTWHLLLQSAISINVSFLPIIQPA